ncbi:hypothetical protein [Patulibacter sp. SYSU D01012]|uniref:hypothetical protein n=1 Tax=Patulibacter sp. SYSU D01012 TaxID=2817381 RepID=UPI001B315EA6|nr:hypothetical protein [Patulibacter sp. SYSU D01012]
MPETETIDDDADVRYREDITGYPRPLRGRVRKVEQQVALVATKRIRDTTRAASCLMPETLELEVKQLGAMRGLLRYGYAGVGNLRELYVSIAATAIICAEAADRPPYLADRAPQPPAAFFGDGSFDWRAAARRR